MRAALGGRRKRLALLATGVFALCLAAAVSGATAAVGPTDLSLTKSDSPDPIIVGNNLAYTIKVENKSSGMTADASSVIVTDPLPASADITYVSSSATQGTCQEQSNTVTCSLGTLTAGTTATVTIVVKTRRAKTLSNTATVSSPEDSAPANNSDTETTTVNSATTTTPKTPKAPKGKKKTKASCASATILGTEGNDNLVGTSGPDVIVSLGGNDQILAGGGNDLVCAGAGFDFVYGDSGGDTLIGGGNADRLVGGDGGDLLKGKNGRDRLSGQRGNDVLDGGRRRDRCRGGAGRDFKLRCP